MSRTIFAAAVVVVSLSLPQPAQAQERGCPDSTEMYFGVRVCEEPAERVGYDRDAFGEPYRSLEDDIIEELPQMDGQVYTPYTCALFGIQPDGTAGTDIEHIVALAEAYDSGLDESRYREFAGDLWNLTVADPSVNRSKGDRDAGEWIPDRNRGWFRRRVLIVKSKYSLSVDPAERDALERILRETRGEQEIVCDREPSDAVIEVDQHEEVLPNQLDRVTVTLSDFTPEAASATVTMIGHHSGTVTDSPFCLEIRPMSIEIPLSGGSGQADWAFSNRFDPRYRLRCRIRAEDGMGGWADGRIQTVGGEHRITLDPAEIEPGATTAVEVEVWIAGGYSNGQQVDFVDPRWLASPVVARCDGVMPRELRLGAAGRRLSATWDVTTTDEVECPVTLDHPGFEGEAVLSVVGPMPIPALPPLDWLLDRLLGR